MSRFQAQEVTVNADDSESDEDEPTIEVVEDGSNDVAGKKPRRRRRLKLYVVFHGDRASRRLPHSVRVKCPRDGSWDMGPTGPQLLKETFAKRYNEVHPRSPLDAAETYLVDQFGTVLAEDDTLRLYVQTEGVLHLMLGDKGRTKQAPNKVVQWGYNSLQSSEPISPGPMHGVARSRVVSIDCGWLHAAAVLECGACIAWGSNEFGQLGTGHELKSAEPVTCATDRDVRFKKVVCGSYFTAVVSQDDELYTWGRYQASNYPTKFAETWTNGYEKRGELGIKGEKVDLVAVGESHTLISTKSGKLFAWGYNEQLQLGWGESKSDKEGQQKPRECKLPKGSISETNKVTALACGGLHSCVVLADGKMYAWGSNHEGQIGHVLRQAHGEPDTVSSMEHETCVKISCGRYSTLAITATGCAYFWGSLSGSAHVDAPSSDVAEKKLDEGEAPAFGSEAKQRSGGGASRMLAGAAKQLVGTDIQDGNIGEAHGLLLTRKNELEGWGYNAYGQALGRTEAKSDLVEEPRAVDVANHHRPGTTKVLAMCVAGGTSTLLVAPQC